MAYPLQSLTLTVLLNPDQYMSRPLDKLAGNHPLTHIRVPDCLVSMQG